MTLGKATAKSIITARQNALPYTANNAPRKHRLKAHMPNDKSRVTISDITCRENGIAKSHNNGVSNYLRYRRYNYTQKAIATKHV